MIPEIDIWRGVHSRGQRISLTARNQPPDSGFPSSSKDQSPRVTPTMASGVTTKMRSLTDMVRVLEPPASRCLG
jgi:hypothetical protein